ncbi:hypothetical protein LCGC14_1166270 [marine sediment metagenome]|uniref:DOD-type homing endonuclease domain-containing protein n=1 Tax=marine sediment metagenome TaxID=412755 RepID=A0A0F9LW15_9ZZZZ
MPRTTDLPKAAIVTRYNGGESCGTLAVAYGRAESTMRENLHRWGAAIRRRGPARTYTLDEAFFHSIDTEAKAYWLGFILADGRVGRTGAGNWICRVDLSVRDEGHLRKLAAAVKTTAPIKIGHHGASAYLDLCSVQLCYDLRLLGCTPHKTGKHGTPAIDAELKYHFYRGYFDGDGSLFAVPQIHAWRVDVIGATGFIKEFQNWLVQRAAVKPTKLRQVDCSADVSSLRYTGGPQIERIMRLLYDGANDYLDRKYDRFMELLGRSKRRTT